MRLSNEMSSLDELIERRIIMGYRLKKFREEKGLTQTKLSEMSGVSRQTIASMESAKSCVVTTKTLLRLANALGVRVETLFFAEDA